MDEGVAITVKKALITISCLNIALCLLYYGWIRMRYNQTDWFVPILSIALLVLEMIRILLSKHHLFIDGFIHVVLVSVLLTQIPKIAIFIELKYSIPVIHFFLFSLLIFAQIVCLVVVVKQHRKANR